MFAALALMWTGFYYDYPMLVEALDSAAPWEALERAIRANGGCQVMKGAPTTAETPFRAEMARNIKSAIRNLKEDGITGMGLRT